MLKIVSLTFLVVVTMMSLANLVSAEQPELYGLVLVIDPGHGGTDPGANGIFQNNGSTDKVVEDEYVYDVALRLAKMAKKYGAIVIMTTYDSKQTVPYAGGQKEVIAPDQNEVFVTSGKKARSGKNRYLRQRTEAANKALETYPRHRVVFMSIHFDSTGNPKLTGAHLIGPNTGTPTIVSLLEEEFRKEHRLRTLDGVEYHPVQRNGVVRNLFVLREIYNHVDQRVLVELGNFTNPADVWRIRDYHIRENYAQIMLRALIKLNQTTDLLVCR